MKFVDNIKSKDHNSHVELPNSHRSESEDLVCSSCSQTAKYRPLVGENGDFLCDDCYRTLFPATAMCDVNFKNKKHQQMLKQEMNQDDDLVNEDEECRLCLEQGYLRKCCQNFYCHECFQKSGYCPGCGEEVHYTGITAWKAEDPGVLAVAGTWVITILFILTVSTFIITFIWNELTVPTTIWGHKCKSWFPSCNHEVCINLGDNVLHGLPNDYTYCDARSTINKVFGSICIFDSTLYKSSQKSMGFDFCHHAPRERISKPFREGAYIFEDNFDYWSSSTDFTNKSVSMASARWNDMMNAETTTICGVNNLMSKRKSLQLPETEDMNRNSALVFTGVHYRYAETIDLDLSYGGMLEFFLKMAPIVENDEDVLCKPAYGGDITVSFSTDKGATWNSIATYPVWKHRGETFSEILEIIPPQAWSNQTRFRWQQNSFDSSRDYWALDDVNIFRYFDQEWMNSEEFLARRNERDNKVQHAQCCFETEQCKQYPTRYLSREDCKGISNDDDTNNQIQLRNAEWYVLYTMMAAIIKAISVYVRSKILRSSSVSKLPRFPTVVPEVMYQNSVLFNSKIFRFQVHITWAIISIAAFSLVIIVAGLCLVAVLFESSFYHGTLEKYNLVPIGFFSEGKITTEGSTKTSSFIAFMLAILLDSRAVLWIWQNAFVLHRKWLPKIEVDTTPDHNHLRIGNLNIPLTAIKEVTMFTRRFCWFLIGLYFLGGFPFTSLCIIMRSTWLSYNITSPLVHTIGWLSVTREILGPDCFVKFFLSIGWILSRSREARDDMGRALKHERVIFWTKYLSFSTALATWFLSGIMIGNLFQVISMVATLIGFYIGILVGSMLGMLQDLPISPHIVFSRWPSKGHAIRYNHTVRCPCIFTCAQCSAMQSYQRLLILFLDDMVSYKQLLKGERHQTTQNESMSSID